MKLCMYSVYDAKARAYITPFFLGSDAIAMREFQHCANDPGHAFCRFAADFTLFRLGEFDSENAKVVTYEPVSIGRAFELKSDLFNVVPGQRRIPE